MTAKLLYQLDTDWTPSVFDSVVGFDGGADHVIGHANVTPGNVAPLVDGAIYTRGPKEKRFSALFVGGSNLEQGEAVLRAVTERFFGKFRVSVMIDSNGCNTTAAAGVALLAKAAPLSGKRAVVLAGTGPVGMRAAALLALEGAQVLITGRRRDKTEAAAAAINARFGVTVEAVEATDNASRAAAVRGARIIFAAGAAGQSLLDEPAWKDEHSVEMVADLNPQPPLGLAGMDAMDKAREYHGKIAFGALGIGGLKLKLHRACIAKLFETHDQVFDAHEIYLLAREMA
jgi:hypothetical protein